LGIAGDVSIFVQIERECAQVRDGDSGCDIDALGKFEMGTAIGRTEAAGRVPAVDGRRIGGKMGERDLAESGTIVPR
jgi:hypothetical protein